MCWLLLVIWFEYKISRTISNPRLEITCFNPVELTPQPQRREGRSPCRSEEDWLLIAVVTMLPHLSAPGHIRGCSWHHIRHPALMVWALSVSSSWGSLGKSKLVIENDMYFMTWLGPNGWQIWLDPRTDISQQPLTIICRYIQPDSDSNNTDIITGPNIPGQFQIKTLRHEGLGCGLLPRLWMTEWEFECLIIKEVGSRGRL